MFGESGKGAGVREREAGQGKTWVSVLKEGLTHGLQEAEQVAYSNTQVVAGQAPTNASAQDVQPTSDTTGVTDTGTMDVDGDSTAQEAAGEGHGGVKRKADEDAVPAAKKLRIGMFMA